MNDHKTPDINDKIEALTKDLAAVLKALVAGNRTLASRIGIKGSWISNENLADKLEWIGAKGLYWTNLGPLTLYADNDHWTIQNSDQTITGGEERSLEANKEAAAQAAKNIAQDILNKLA